MTQADFLDDYSGGSMSPEDIMYLAQTVTDNDDLMIAAHELDRAQAIFDSELIKIGFMRG